MELFFQLLPILGVIVNGDQIAAGMLPTIVIQNQTGRIQRFGGQHHCVAVGLLGLIGLYISHAPGFVHRRPNHDTGMVIVSQHRLYPLFVDPADILLGVDIGRADLAPNQQA